jgi:exopolysaccharide production protein ExoY
MATKLILETATLNQTGESTLVLAPVPAVVRLPERVELPKPPHDFRTARGNEMLIRALDIVMALAMIVFLMPLIVCVTVLLMPSGKVIFAQNRIGRDGREFRCFKFRTMVVDAEARLASLLETCPISRAEWDASQKLKNDPRITPIGRFLRRTSLDELPQLLNILTGTMSVVGPRPIVRNEVARYGRYFPRYCAVRPGLTGLWQVSGRSDVDYQKRIALDILYVKRRSTMMNMSIVLKTPMMVVSRNGSY